MKEVIRRKGGYMRLYRDGVLVAGINPKGKFWGATKDRSKLISDYTFNVTLKYTNIGIEGRTLEEAKENLKALYKEHDDIDLQDSEIEVVE